MVETKTFDTLALIEKRFNLLVGAHWEDREDLEKAIKEQDRIRMRLSKRLKGKDSTQIIREWRDKRCRY